MFSCILKKKKFFFKRAKIGDFVISERNRKLTVETVHLYCIISEGSFSLKRFLIVFLPFFFFFFTVFVIQEVGSTQFCQCNVLRSHSSFHTCMNRPVDGNKTTQTCSTVLLVSYVFDSD